ncbi:MAG TPA: SH3 domain-containing protein, partial [Ktedonobacteraceae bacterium]
MRTNNKRYIALGLCSLLTMLMFTLSSSYTPLAHASSTTGAHSAPSQHATNASSIWTGITTDWANVRTAPTTNSTIATTYAPDTTVTVYVTVSGEIVWDGISNWYRISSLNSSPLYIYAGLV